MTTLVVQAYQPRLPDRAAPRWIVRCCDSVQAWAGQAGYAYQLIERDFLELSPVWVREKCGETVHPVTDLARLYLLRQQLESGYERVVWLDADVLVFDPAALSVECESGCAFGSGSMIGERPDGAPFVGPYGTHNGIVVMTRRHPMLDFYIYAAEQLLRRTAPEKITRTMVGPPFLDALSRAVPIECIRSVGWITPALASEIAVGQERLAKLFRQAHPYPVAAVDLCHFFRRQIDLPQRPAYDRLMEAVLDILLATQGNALSAKNDQRA